MNAVETIQSAADALAKVDALAAEREAATTVYDAALKDAKAEYDARIASAQASYDAAVGAHRAAQAELTAAQDALNRIFGIAKSDPRVRIG